MCSPKPLIQTGRWRAAARQVGVGDQHPGAALDPHHRLEHVDRVGDHRTVQHVVHGDRLAVEHRRRVGARRWSAGPPRSSPKPMHRSRIRPRSVARSARTERSGRRCRTGSRTPPAANRSCCSTPRTNPGCGRAAAASAASPAIPAPPPAPRHRCPIRPRQRPATPCRRMSHRPGPPGRRNPVGCRGIRTAWRARTCPIPRCRGTTSRSPQRVPPRRLRSPSWPVARTGPT